MSSGALDAGGRTHRLIGELFPFHLLLYLGSEPMIQAAGSTLERWTGQALRYRPFGAHFSIERPAIAELTARSLRARSSSVFILDIAGGQRQLRGQMLVIAPDQVLFVGSPVLTASLSIDDLGLSMADLAPHDATLDMIVVQRFSEMQVDDLKERATELREAVADRDRFIHRATTDPLTGLANRRAFWDRCEDLVATDQPLALLFVDVDHFKAVNDVHGHAAGDLVLRSIADRLASSVRSDDLVARLGGDEFAVVLAGAGPDLTERSVAHITETVATPVDVAGERIPISVSVGVVTDDGTKDVDELIQDADVAMYEGRQAGPGRVTWFVDRMRRDRAERRLLADELRRTLDRGRIDTVYQPIVRLDDRSIVTCEALARWHHPTQGPIPPTTFIEVAEGAGLIERLDLLVLGNALAELRSWRTIRPDLGVQVNLSGGSIRHGLDRSIAAALAEAGVPASALTIEVTESWLIRNESEVAAVLHEVADLGVRVHLDDFGTGYSSLTHVQTLPITGLKIDRSFVGQATASERSRRVVAATVGLARSLDLEVVAEGVETESVAALLSQLGCDLAQGFLFAPPQPASELGRALGMPAGR